MYGYDPSTGRIVFTANHPVPEGLATAIEAQGMKAHVGPIKDIATWYIRTLKGKTDLHARPELVADWIGGSTVAADGVSTISFTAPANTQVFVDDVDAGVTTGDPFDIAASEPGNYTISLFCWPYLHKTLTFTAE